MVTPELVDLGLTLPNPQSTEALFEILGSLTGEIGLQLGGDQLPEQVTFGLLPQTPNHRTTSGQKQRVGNSNELTPCYSIGSEGDRSVVVRTDVLPEFGRFGGFRRGSTYSRLWVCNHARWPFMHHVRESGDTATEQEVRAVHSIVCAHLGATALENP